MRVIVGVGLLLLASVGATEAWAGGMPARFSAGLVKTFRRQCMDATGNRPLCVCATKAFRKFRKGVPANAVRLGPHSSGVSIQVLRATADYEAVVASDVAQCEARHPSDDDG